MNPTASRESTAFSALLQRLGAQPRAYHALLRAYFLMDFRSQHFGQATASKPHERISPLFWVVGQYLTIGALGSALLLGRVDVWFFAFANLSVAMGLIASAVIVEFNEIVLDPADSEVIGHHPLHGRTYALARLSNLLGYVLLMSAAIIGVPCIAGLGLKDAAWSFLPAYITAALLGNLTVTGWLIVLYTTILRGGPSHRAREMLAWTQIILIMVLFYGGQAVMRDPNETLEMVAYRFPEWARWLPPSFLATWLVSLADGTPRWDILGGALLVTGSGWLIAMRQLALLYSRLQPQSALLKSADLPPLPASGQLCNRLGQSVTRSPEEAAGYWLGNVMLSRDYDLQMRSWPNLGMVLALVLLGLLTGQLQNPMTHRDSSGLLAVACLYLLALPLPVVIYNFNFSSAHAASWLLDASPLARSAAFRDGLRKAATYRIFVPALLLLTILFAWLWRDLGHALLQGFIGLLLLDCAGHLGKWRLLRALPFASSLARGETLGPTALFTALLNALAFALGGLQWWASGSTAGLVGFVLLLLVATLFLRRRTWREAH